MSTQPHARTKPSRIVRADARSQTDAVRPALLVRLVLAPLTKVLNPLVGSLAGRRHVPMAKLRHIGRRTGTSYLTSVGARVRGGVVLIPLTFGNRSDWARNVEATGQCSVQVNGYTFRAQRPRFLAAAEAAPLVRALFNPAERLVFKVLGIKQFMRLDAAV
jgi:deazaflavin-dependent oxidoreductase (nitroreductase family)